MQSWRNGIIYRLIYIYIFIGSPSTTIISCYRPTNTSDEKCYINFYNELSSLGSCITKHNVIIIGENINAQIGKDENNNYTIPQKEMGNAKQISHLKRD